jgi:hypothetical protein
MALANGNGTGKRNKPLASVRRATEGIKTHAA